MNRIKILIPVYNDWQSVFKLLENINSVISKSSCEFSVIIINDASTENRPEFQGNLDNLKSIQVINMQENKGHADRGKSSSDFPRHTAHVETVGRAVEAYQL